MPSQCARGQLQVFLFIWEDGYVQKITVDSPMYSCRKVRFVQLSRNPSLTRRTHWTSSAYFILAITFARNILRSHKYLASYVRVARRNVQVSGSLNTCNMVVKTARFKLRSRAYVFWATDGVIKQTVNKCIAIYIHSIEIHNVVALIKCLLVLRCQLYMFRTVTVHLQELLCRYCMCRLWYVVRDALYDTSSWYSSWGWTVTVRNMYSRHLSTNKHLISATTLCILLDCIYIAKKWYTDLPTSNVL